MPGLAGAGAGSEDDVDAVGEITTGSSACFSAAAASAKRLAFFACHSARFVLKRVHEPVIKKIAPNVKDTKPTPPLNISSYLSNTGCMKDIVRAAAPAVQHAKMAMNTGRGQIRFFQAYITASVPELVTSMHALMKSLRKVTFVETAQMKVITSQTEASPLLQKA